MDYGKGIRLARAARGISQKDLAARLRLDPSYLSLLERGARKPSAATLAALAEELRVPLYLLILLGSDAEDLRGVSPEEAQVLGRQLLEVLTLAEQEART